jgi:hypothetical protein
MRKKESPSWRNDSKADSASIIAERVPSAKKHELDFCAIARQPGQWATALSISGVPIDIDGV